ncbi:MAG: NAD(P)H-binding protein [Phycisphaera sp.]|nr:MAG: NAD(P)H-binding protein [Phycisphaera sp.]
MNAQDHSTPGDNNRALVVGGTGMLAGVVEALAARGWQVAVLARGPTRLDALASLPGVTPLRADYTDAKAFADAVRSVLPVDVVVAWVHSTAPEAPQQLASLVTGLADSVDFYHVQGSAAGRAPGDDEIASVPGVAYRRVVLGFVVDAGRSRWLTDQEISQGVLEAIDRRASWHVVGQLEPWSQRP